jgi:hypothetical protein
MEFNTVEHKFPIQRAVQLTVDNIEEAAESVNGSISDSGILEFQISNRTLHGLPGDWLVVFGTDVHIYTDKYFQRNYNSV